MSGAQEFKLIRVPAAGAFEQGEAYGAQARHEIGLCLEMYREHFAMLRSLKWSDAAAEAQKYLPLTEAALPYETEMLRGTAAGAGVSFEDIMVLNTRYEMLHYPKNECTTFAVLKSASRGEKVFIGQNWDQRPAVVPHSLLLHITMKDGLRIIGMTEAGQLPRNGMNSLGLGIVASGLNSSLDSRRTGIPGNFSRMRALRSKSFGEMTEVLAAAQRSVANNYCIASAPEDRAADIECIPGAPAVLLPENGIVTHANHILSDPRLDTSNGKKFRGERLAELLGKRAGDITADDIKECLSDHLGFPDSLCSHIDGDAADTHKQWMTVASMIYDLSGLELELCRGNPCAGEYRKYLLMEL